MTQKVTLEISVSKQAAVGDLRAWGDDVKKTFGDVLAQSSRLNTALGKLSLNPDGISFGVKSALTDLGELNGALKEVRESLRGIGALKFSPVKAGLGTGLREEADKAAKGVTGVFQREAEQQRRLDDSLMSSRYRNLQVSGMQYRDYLTHKLSEENISVQRSIRLNNELADLQIDAMRRVSEAMRQEDQKRAAEARQAARQQDQAARAAARVASGSLLVQRGTGLSAIGSGVRNVGQAMTWGYSAPVAGAVGYSVNKAIDYEADFANVKKTVGGSDAELKTLRADLEDLSTKVPESFKAITDIASTVGQLGVARGEVTEVTKDIIQLHVATKLTTDTGAMNMVKFANSIGLPAKDIGRLGSVISELDKDSKATSNEVLAMALRIGGVGHVAGLSGPQILAFANAFAGVGVRAQQGGSAIQTAIIQIDRATTTGGTKLAQFANVAGMTSDQFRKAFKENAAGALAAFVEGLGKLHDSHTDLIPVMDALGLKSKLEIDALLRASGAGTDLSKALGRVDKAYSDNTATGVRYTRATDNTQASLKKLRNESDLVAARFGTDLMPTIKEMLPDVEAFLKDITHLISEFESLPEPVRRGAMELLALSIAAGPVVTGFGNVLSIVGSVTRGLGYLKGLRAAKELADIAGGAESVATNAGAAETAVGGLSGKLGALKTLLLSPVKAAGTLGGFLLGTGAGTALVAGALPLALGGVLKAGIGGTSALDQEKELFALAGPGSVVKGTGPAPSGGKASPGIEQWDETIARVAREQGIDPNVIKAIIHNETGGNPLATNHNRNGTTDYGIMQVNSATKDPSTYNWRDAYTNMTVGVEEFKGKLARAGGDLRGGFRRYNGAGPAAEAYADRAMSYYSSLGGTATGGGGGSPSPAKRTPYSPALFAGGDKAAEAQSDLSKRLYEATHDEYQNRRYEAYQTFKDDKSTDPAKAKALLLATLKQIDKDEQKEQKDNHDKTEKQQKEHLARLEARQKQYWVGVLAGRRAVEAAKSKASEARSEIGDHMAALQDPDAAAFDQERAAAQKRFRERVRAFGGDPALTNDRLQRMPYSPQALKDFQAAQGELQGSLDDIQTRQGQKAVEAAQKVKDQAAQDAAEVADFQKQAASEQAQLSREVWQHAGGDMKKYFDSLRTEADDALKEVQAKYGVGSKNPNAVAVAAAQGVHDSRYALIAQEEADDAKSAQEKIDQAQADSVRFEYEQHIISLRQYQDYLKQKLALTKMYDTPEDQKNGVLSKNWMQVKGDLDSSEGERPAKPPRGQLVGGQPFWDGLADSASEQGSRVLDALFNPKDKKKIFQSMWVDLKQSAEESLKGGLKSILKNFLTGSGGGDGGSGSGGGLLGGLLGGLFGGKKAAGSGGSGGVTSVMDMIGGAQGGGVPVTASPLSNLGGIGSLLTATGIPGGAGLSMLGMTGMGGDPGMGGGGSGGLGGMMGGGSSPLGLLSMLGKGGIGGLFSHGGLFTGSGALGGFGAAMPWIGGGLMLNSLLGNPLGKALKGIKKLFHFSQGGFVPGQGTGDTVPAMLTPGEFVMPRAMAAQAFAPRMSMPDFRAGGGGHGTAPQGQTAGERSQNGDTISVVVHQTGDHIYRSELDIHAAKQAWAKDMQKARRTGIPVT